MRHTRIKLPGPASYHITSRVKNDDFLLEDSEDKRVLLDIIRRTAEFAGVTVMSYAILDNHFHLLARIPAPQDIGDAELERRARVLWGDEMADERFERWRFWESHGKAARAESERRSLRRRMFDITPFVRTIKEMFTRAYNQRHGRRGTVWGASRFKSAAVAPDLKTLATVAAYIDLNAVRARITRHPKNYKWCGFGAAKKGDARAIAGIAALGGAEAGAKPGAKPGAKAGGAAGAGVLGKKRGADSDAAAALDDAAVVALEAYARFLDGTKNQGDRHSSEASRRNDSARWDGAAAGREDAAERRRGGGGYVRKTLDSADLTRLGVEGVARWLADSEIQPESLSEMWTRRIGNLVIGGVIGPAKFLLELPETLVPYWTHRKWWLPGVIEETCTLISERNEKAKKRNAS